MERLQYVTNVINLHQQKRGKCHEVTYLITSRGNSDMHGLWTHEGSILNSLGADSLAEYTPNHSNIFSPKCLPKPKILGFFKKEGLSGCT